MFTSMISASKPHHMVDAATPWAQKNKLEL